MSENYWKYSIIAGIITFFLALIFFVTIHSPSPFIAGGIVAFIIFEIFFYHFHARERDKQKLM